MISKEAAIEVIDQILLLFDHQDQPVINNVRANKLRDLRDYLTRDKVVAEGVFFEGSLYVEKGTKIIPVTDVFRYCGKHVQLIVRPVDPLP